jgi:hypothetical protein
MVAPSMSKVPAKLWSDATIVDDPPESGAFRTAPPSVNVFSPSEPQVVQYAEKQDPLRHEPFSGATCAALASNGLDVLYQVRPTPSPEAPRTLFAAAASGLARNVPNPGNRP